MQRVSLSVNGHNKRFTRKELELKLCKLEWLEEYLDAQEPEEDDMVDEDEYEVNHTPAEGKCFQVNPISIIKNEKIFKRRRKDTRQKLVRWFILQAIKEVKKNPEKYLRPFKTIIPRKTWERKTAKEQKKIADKWNGHMANWVEQALEWAQRILNGESWETICNKPDSISWNRLVIWDDGSPIIVGGCRKIFDGHTPSDVIAGKLEWFNVIACTVPLIVVYD